MKIDGWACRSVLSIPAPIAIGGGVGGRQAPRYRRTLISRTLTQRPPRAGGCHPRTPAHDCPGHARTGRAEHLSMKNGEWACQGGLPVPAPIATSRVFGGQQAPRQRTLRFSRTRTFSMRREDRTNSESRLCPGVATPGPPRAIAPNMRGRGGAVHLLMKIDGWACWSVFSIPAPIAIGGGVGGQQAPRQGLLGYQELSRSQSEETIERIEKGASARGLHPRTPACDCPGHAGTGRSSASGDEKILRVKAGAAFPSLPLSPPAGGPGGSRPPGRGCSITCTRTHHHPRAAGSYPRPATFRCAYCRAGPILFQR